MTRSTKGPPVRAAAPPRKRFAAGERLTVLLAAAICVAGANSRPTSAGQPQSSREAALAGAPSAHTVVVELFTSQGCSSCPPADRLLARIGEESGGRVVPLSFHVDFWNHDGWTDPFSGREWTERQVAYARALRVGQVYTPQAVVDGGAEMVGSDGASLEAAIAAAAARPAAEISLRVEPAASKVLVEAEVSCPEALRGRKLDLMLAIFETGLVTAVGRGENGGHTLRNDYVVRSLRRGARVTAEGAGPTRHTQTLALASDWKREHLGVAAFLQDPRSLEIRGASSMFLSKGEGDRASAHPAEAASR
jgi:hypothetical protein